MALLIGFYGNRLLWSVSKRGNTKLHNAIEWIIPQKGGKSTASDVKFTTFGVFVCHGGHTNRARGNYYAKQTNQPARGISRAAGGGCAGHPALYTAEGTGSLATYEEIYTHLLPESDVLALQQGVYLANEAELQQRLEDYGL